MALNCEHFRAQASQWPQESRFNRCMRREACFEERPPRIPIDVLLAYITQHFA